jgi:pyruvate,orthophosphate dikinase
VSTMRWVRRFEDGTAEQRDLLGGKGANLAEMTRMGLPVPPGFTITTEACRAWMAGDETLPDGLLEEVHAAVAELEARTGLGFGDPEAPLLVSVRSGARYSMPGMMDTLLNLGLSPATRPGVVARTGDERFADDALRRVVELFGRVVLGIPDERFQTAAEEVLAAHGVPEISRLDAAGMAALVEAYQDVTAAADPPARLRQDPWAQLTAAIEAVFRSWNGRRARDYRRLEGIPDDLGTAVNVQVMVFGNTGPRSGTGVAFTRDPATGEATPMGDFLVDAQGEDVVAGIRNTLPLADMADVFPACHAELAEVMHRLEQRYRDMCDLEFTVEDGTLYVLQTRVGKRTAAAALQMAVDMVDEGLIDPETAVSRFDCEQMERLLHPGFAPDADYEVLATGLGASPGAAVGRVVFTADEAEARGNAGEEVILVRPQTSPEDLHGIVASRAILTSRGGLVSHAAVVARGIGTPAVCGAEAVAIDRDGTHFTVGEVTVTAGDVISVDGTTGEVALGAVPVVAPQSPPELERLLGWADELRRLQVWANADTGADAAVAREHGAEGIGLCRTEHQFLGDRLPVVQRVILAETEDEEARALDELYTVQRADFVELLDVMDGLPVTVRLLDPPLHEFLPSVDQLLVQDALGTLDADGKHRLDAAMAWREDNPMLGIRGVRLGLLRPRLYAMQVRALLDAAVELAGRGGDPRVRVMIPLVSAPAELARALADVRAAITDADERAGRDLGVRVGAMVETPRAAVLAGELAVDADFLSFGTNDLTQMTFGFSRDDVEGRLMPLYLDQHLLPVDPFRSLDVDGVGRLVRGAVDAARASSPGTELGVCGEHGGDPTSITFFHEAGFDEVSCSPHRVATARLAAARAAFGDAARGPGATA